MEKERSVVPPEDSSESGSERKKKSSKKRNGFGVPLVPISHDGSKATEEKRQKPSAPDGMLANLALKHQREVEAKQDAKEAKDKMVEPEGQTEDSRLPDSELNTEDSIPQSVTVAAELPQVGRNLAESPTKTAETMRRKKGAETELVELPAYELEPAEFSGGEVIIDLGGNVPVAERVVLLRETASSKPVSDEGREPVSHHQPEQQHQADEAELEPVPEAGGAMPPTPPIETWPPAGYFEAPEPKQPEQSPAPVTGEILQSQPAVLHSAYEQAVPGPAPVATNGEHLATKQDVEDAVYYATKNGMQRGLVTGLFVGGLYEHFKHRRREKKAEKRYQKQSKQLEEARQNYTFGLQEQERQQSEASRQLKTAERRYSDLEQRQAAEKRPEQHMIRTPEQVAAENAQQLAVPEGHRLETSAWHTIEVDAKTGKAVEKPAFEYGEEYQHERAPENVGNKFTDEDATSAKPEALADLTAAAQIPSATTRTEHPMPPADLPSASIQGPPSGPKEKAKAALQSVTKSTSSSSAGPIWPWILALLVIAALLMLVL
jgi:hypothetical protein